MMDNVFQCCYTNDSEESEGNITSGWKALAVSNSIPPDAYRTCVTLQNQNSAIQSSMTDERGNVLNLLELCGDGKYLYMIRSQYGMMDRLGRPNMFSHAYIFPWSDASVLLNPNKFLTIANSNFKSNKADAARETDSFERLQEFNIWRAIQASGLKLVTVYLLIQCIYAQMTEKRISSPLYVQYDGTDMQMRALLYCAYLLLPHHLRKNLRSACAGGVTEQNKNIIFSANALTRPLFFNPATGENNILTDRLRRKIQRQGYIDYAATHYIYWNANKYLRNQETLNAEDDIRHYYQTLNGLAASLGDASASNELILKIANRGITMGNQGLNLSTIEDEELITDIQNAIQTEAYSSTLMGKYLFGILDEAYKRGLALVFTDENKQRLFAWLDTPTFKEHSTNRKRFRDMIKN